MSSLKCDCTPQTARLPTTGRNASAFSCLPENPCTIHSKTQERRCCRSPPARSAIYFCNIKPTTGRFSTSHASLFLLGSRNASGSLIATQCEQSARADFTDLIDPLYEGLVTTHSVNFPPVTLRNPSVKIFSARVLRVVRRDSAMIRYPPSS